MKRYRLKRSRIETLKEVAVFALIILAGGLANTFIG